MNKDITVCKRIIEQILPAINFLILARFQLKNGYPALMLIKAGGNDSKTYRGPTDLESLVGFLNEATNEVVEKVNIILKSY